jgi:hypothetical protein
MTSFILNRLYQLQATPHRGPLLQPVQPFISNHSFNLLIILPIQRNTNNPNYSRTVVRQSMNPSIKLLPILFLSYKHSTITNRKNVQNHILPKKETPLFFQKRIKSKTIFQNQTQTEYANLSIFLCKNHTLFY